MAVYNDMSVDDRIRVYDTGLEDRFVDSVDATPIAYRRGDIVSPFVPFVEPLAVQDAHLIDCIRTGSPPRTDGNSGLAVARVLEAANSALISGREVAIHTLPMLNDAEVVRAPDLTRYDTERPLVLDGDTA